MSSKRKWIQYSIVALIIVSYLWFYMLGKTFHPTLSSKLFVKEDILSIIKEENENRVIHLIKTKDKLFRIDYKKVGPLLYQRGSWSSTSFAKDIIVNCFSSSTDDDYFIYGFCGNTNIKKIVFTFPDMEQLEVVPNEEGIFLQLSGYNPQNAEQILGYTDTGETIDVLEYIF